MHKAKYFGWEFKSALTTAIYKIAADLGLERVYVTFKDEIPTAAIDRHGQIYITNIADDAVLTRFDLERFVGYAFHELLHRKFTNFSAIDSSKVHYLVHLHNGLEDAYIENRAIAEKLTGNAEPLLRNLIDNMAREGLAEVTDWAHPAQYPFALAVYARKHATVKVPVAEGLQPIFAEAVRRLNACDNSWQTLDVATWVFDKLTQIQPPNINPNPEPTKGKDKGDNPTDGDTPTDGDEDGTGSPSDDPTGGDQEGGAPTPPTNPAKPPISRGQPVEARKVEPDTKAPEGAETGGTYWTGSITKKEKHTRPHADPVFPINF